MKNRTKARFKAALKFIKKNENTLKKEGLAKHLANKNYIGFWKEIKRINNSNVPLPNVIDDVSGYDKILKLWSSHYSDLFNCLENSGIKEDFIKGNVQYSENLEINYSEIKSAICNLENGKSCGLDNIQGEHLKNCCNRIIPLLKMSFTSMLVHGFLPKSLTSVVLVPIIKNKSESICKSNNYRPIALVSILSKIFERILFNRLEPFLSTSSNQFGFKKKHGTDMCIYTFKETIMNYLSVKKQSLFRLKVKYGTLWNIAF